MNTIYLSYTVMYIKESLIQAIWMLLKHSNRLLTEVFAFFNAIKYNINYMKYAYLYRFFKKHDEMHQE